jgi:hypothetical protein
VKCPKINLSLRDFAVRNHMGIGTFRTKDNIDVEILSNPRTEGFHVFNVKNGQIIKAEGGRGAKAMSKIIDEYEPKQLAQNDVYNAFYHSFNVRV